MVFLHGKLTWSFLWRDVEPVVAENRHVCALDLLGYGNYQITDNFDRSIRAQEAMLADFLDDRVSFVAHDIDGGAAPRYASHYLEVVSALILSIAVCYDSWPVEFVAQLCLLETADAELEDLKAQFEFAFGDGLHGDPVDHPEWMAGIAKPWRPPEAVRRSLGVPSRPNTNTPPKSTTGRSRPTRCCSGVPTTSSSGARTRSGSRTTSRATPRSWSSRTPSTGSSRIERTRTNRTS